MYITCTDYYLRDNKMAPIQSACYSSLKLSSKEADSLFKHAPCLLATRQITIVSKIDPRIYLSNGLDNDQYH